MTKKSKEEIVTPEGPRRHPNGDLAIPAPLPTPSALPSELARDLGDDFDIRGNKMQAEIEARYTPEWVDIFKRLAFEVSVIGLELTEACLICGVDYENLMILVKKDPLIERMIKTKNLEYKRKLLKTVSLKATTDDRLAMSLLQAKYPDEFNPRKGTGQGGGESDEDLLGIAIEFIQKSGDNTPLVTEKTGRMQIIKRSRSNAAEITKKINDILK